MFIPMGLPMDAMLAVGFIAGLVIESCVSVAVARFYTRPMVRKDVQAERVGLEAAILAKLEPAVMRGGASPTDLADARWQREAERARVEVSILAALGQRLGPLKSKMAWAWLPENIKKAAIRAGESGWLDVLEPLLDKLPANLSPDNDATKEAHAPYAVG